MALSSPTQWLQAPARQQVHWSLAARELMKGQGANGKAKVSCPASRHQASGALQDVCVTPKACTKVHKKRAASESTPPSWQLPQAFMHSALGPIEMRL